MNKPQRLAVSSGIRTTGILIGVIFVLYDARDILVPERVHSGTLRIFVSRE